MNAAETLFIVCLPLEEHISWKNIWLTDLPKIHILWGFDNQIRTFTDILKTERWIFKIYH